MKNYALAILESTCPVERGDLYLEARVALDRDSAEFADANFAYRQQIALEPREPATPLAFGITDGALVPLR